MEQWVVVSGGTSGIGLAAAKELSAVGFKTLLLGRNEEKGRKAESLVEGAAFISCDVTKEKEIEKVVSFLKEKGNLKGLVLSQGIYKEALLENTTEEMVKEMFEINVFGSIRLTKVMIPFLREGKGSIVAVASDAALQGNVQCSLYGATKGALTSFIRSLSLELGVEGMRANVVCPGDIDTPLLEEQLESYGGTKEEMGEWYPLGRIGKAEEVGKVISFLISDQSSFMTGAIVPVDGGLTAW